jgi:CspA family cold shock protein
VISHAADAVRVTAGRFLVCCGHSGRRDGSTVAAARQSETSQSRSEHVSVTGKVKFFNETKGFGFFTKDDGTGDVFVHRTELPADIKLLYEGQPVSFEIEKTTRGLRAVTIILI